MRSEPEYPVGTKEFLKTALVSDRSLSTQVVEIMVGASDSWRPATWLGTAGLTRTARTTSVVDFTSYVQQYYPVFARVADGEELIIVYCGRIKVTAI